jgi:hypothetical protein
MAELDERPDVRDTRDYPCHGCGRESTDHVRARFSTPLGTHTIRVCGSPECARAGTERLQAQFPGERVRVLEVNNPPER